MSDARLPKKEPVQVTNFGIFRSNGDFVSTRCSAFQYNKDSYMKMATTFKNKSQNAMSLVGERMLSGKGDASKFPYLSSQQSGRGED